MTKTMPVLSFAKLDEGMPMPHLLDIQTRAFQSLLQPDGKGAERTDIGLERVFKDVFPIQDVNGNYSLEFVKYALGESKYSVEECIERDMTYSVPLKATLQLVDRKSTRLNSSHLVISYAVFCLKKKKTDLPISNPHTFSRLSVVLVTF